MSPAECPSSPTAGRGSGQFLNTLSEPNQSLSGKLFQAGSLKSMVFGGEGLFLATMRGTGRVWLQSMPICKLIRALAPIGANRGKEAGGLLGNLFQ